MLQFGMKPPFSFEKFLRMCEEHIPERDFGIIKTASLSGEYSCNKDRVYPAALKEWHCFDTALRNELVRIRSARRHLDPDKYLRRDAGVDAAIARIAMNVYRTPSILEAERVLDKERWHKLEELALGHYFDIDFLIVYAHKLLILDRWGNVHTADKQNLLAKTLKRKEG
jgi:hypothetical protein